MTLLRLWWHFGLRKGLALWLAPELGRIALIGHHVTVAFEGTAAEAREFARQMNAFAATWTDVGGM